MNDASESVRLGIVGVGFMGQTHAENAESFGHEVVAGADPVSEPREEFTRTYEATGYADFETMYDEEVLDAVVVSTPNAFHEPAVVAALERGCHVLCEKPLAHTLESAERIAAAADRSDGFCMVNFHNRFTTAISVFKAYQAEGRFGDVSHVQANYVRRRGIPGIGSWFTDEEQSGGGAVVDIGVHAIDFALYVMDFPAVEDVFAVTRSQFGIRENYVDPDDWFDPTEASVFDVEDSATALIRCTGDRTISLEVAWATNRERSTEFVVSGTDGGARMDLGGDELTVYEAREQGTDHLVESSMTGGSLDNTGWSGCDEVFLDAAANDDPPDLNSVEQALTVQRVIDAIYRSAETGRSVAIAEKTHGAR